MLPASQKGTASLSRGVLLLIRSTISSSGRMNCLHSSLFTAATVHLGRQPSEDGGAILPSRFSFRSLAFRTCATATDQQSADYKPLHPDVSIDLAIEAACRALGRAPGLSEAELAEKLRANWFSSAADIAQMTDSQASALGFPLKLKAWLTEALASNNSSYATEASLYSSVDFEALQTGTRPPETTIAGAISDTEVESDEESEEIASSKDSFLSPARVSTPPPAAASLRGAIEEQPGWETLPIEERVCPSKRRFGYLAIDRPNVVSRSRATKYALGKDELTESLKTEFAALHRFGTTKFFGAQADPIEEVTANKYADHLRGMLGWLHRVRGVPLEELSLRSLVPSNERGAVATTFDYAQWLVTERSINVRTELLVLRSVLFAAKFLYHDESAVEVNSSSRPYSDLTVVKELRTLIGTANKAYKVAPRVADETMKWLDWPEYLNLCRELKKECALLLPNGKQRVIKAVAVSVQRYLMFAILACVPDRQRTLRELQVGKTLVKEGDRWIIRHGPKDYKTG